MSLEEITRLRQGVYRLAGAGFSYPTGEMISATGEAMALFEDLGIYDFSFAPEVATASEELSRADEAELAVVYVSLFEAGVAGAACPPHETAYRTDAATGGVAELRSELKRTILRYGLKLDEGAGDMVDHVATEMHVMAMLCRRESERRDAGDSSQRILTFEQEFLTRHLLPWVPAFARSVESAVPGGPYDALARAVRAFLAHERQLLPILTQQSQSV